MLSNLLVEEILWDLLFEYRPNKKRIGSIYILKYWRCLWIYLTSKTAPFIWNFNLPILPEALQTQSHILTVVKIFQVSFTGKLHSIFTFLVINTFLRIFQPISHLKLNDFVGQFTRHGKFIDSFYETSIGGFAGFYALLLFTRCKGIFVCAQNLFPEDIFLDLSYHSLLLLQMFCYVFKRLTMWPSMTQEHPFRRGTSVRNKASIILTSDKHTYMYT